MSETCRETNGKRSARPIRSQLKPHLLIFFAPPQVVGAAAAGLEAQHPIRAGHPGGQVLRHGGHHGNTEKTPRVSAGTDNTGKYKCVMSLRC